MSGTRDIHPPRLERFGPKTLTGLLRSHRTTQEDQALYASVAAQWNDYANQALTSSLPVAKQLFGVGLHQADGDLYVQYFCGAEGKAREGFATLQIPPLYCAVFQYRDHPSQMRQFLHMIYRTVLPTAGIEPAPHGPGEPEFIERYDHRFNHTTGEGVFDLLFPIKE